MATPITDLLVEVAQGDLETKYVELGDETNREQP